MGEPAIAAPPPRARPILFSAPMVRAILDGRKTQTRRPVKNEIHHIGPGGSDTPEDWGIGDEHGYWYVLDRSFPLPGRLPADGTYRIPCPYGEPGDRLWVRETWFEAFDPATARPYDPPRACYAATQEGEVRKMDDDGGTVFRKNGEMASPWRPGIHMPRWASRLLLEVTEVRVERVAAISEADARAEGFADPLAFMDAWAGMYGAGPFGLKANPWVWVVGFRRIA